MLWQTTILFVVSFVQQGQIKTGTGITQPNMSSQELLIRSTYEKAGLEPRDTDFIEAHGTGTPVGGKSIICPPFGIF